MSRRLRLRRANPEIASANLYIFEKSPEFCSNAFVYRSYGLIFGTLADLVLMCMFSFKEIIYFHPPKCIFNRKKQFGWKKWSEKYFDWFCCREKLIEKNDRYKKSIKICFFSTKKINFFFVQKNFGRFFSDFFSTFFLLFFRFSKKNMQINIRPASVSNLSP